jgi:hypothetical protein
MGGNHQNTTFHYPAFRLNQVPSTIKALLKTTDLINKLSNHCSKNISACFDLLTQQYCNCALVYVPIKRADHNPSDIQIMPVHQGRRADAPWRLSS